MREAHAKSMFQIGSEEVNFVCAKRTQNQCFKQVLGEVHFVCAKRTQNERFKRVFGSLILSVRSARKINISNGFFRDF